MPSKARARDRLTRTVRRPSAESILAIAGLGLQLSTTRGIVLSIPTRSAPLRIPLSTSRLFLPLNSISDVVINEGIYGWTIIYYLVIIQDDGNGPVKLRVGFPVRGFFSGREHRDERVEC